MSSDDGTLGWQEHTRLTACLSGAFCPFRLDGLRHICASKSKNHSKIHRCRVQSSFAGAEKRSDDEKTAGNTLCISKKAHKIRAQIIRLGADRHLFRVSHEKVTRACLKNDRTPNCRIFLRRSALIFLAIHKVFPRKIALIGAKIPCHLCIPLFFKQALVYYKRNQ